MTLSQAGAASALDDGGVLGRLEGRSCKDRGAHGGIRGGLPDAPLRDGLGVQPVLRGKGAGGRATPEVGLEHAASFGAP
jgi:hypothetical protein